MAAWTEILDSNLEPNAPVRSVDHIAMRDNPVAIAEGAAGAPRNQWGSLESALQDYITACSGIHASGAANYPGKTWVTRDANGTSYAAPPGGAGVVFSNQANRTINFRVRVYFRTSSADDQFTIRVLNSTGGFITSKATSLASNTNYSAEFTLSIGPSKTERYYIEGALGSGGGYDEVFYQGCGAFIPPFF